MPLDHYGVAIGTLVSFTRDSQHRFGSWYHGHVTLNAGGVRWESALDVDAPASVGVAYRLVTDLTLADLGPVGTFAEGWHELARTPASGALDYVRSSRLLDGWVFRWLRRAAVRRQASVAWQPPPADVGQPGGTDPAPFPPAPFGPTRVDDLLRQLERWRTRPWLRWIDTLPLFRWRSFPWVQSSGDNALDALDPHLRAASRIYLFGQRYRDGGNGVHDVHMNQGDPAGSQWWDDNATWQDGAVACQHADGSVVVWQVRFNTQRVPTDDQGHPL
ncbi:MAG TPA: DUF2278 family protein [Conexibacter sp.]|nr:DUF2278 family protein [Conexibacter sp.]